MRKYFSTGNLSLQIKMIMYHVLLIFIPVLLIFFLIFNTYLEDKRQASLSLIMQVNRQAMENIDAYISSVENLSKQILFPDFSTERTILKILSDSNQSLKNTADQFGHDDSIDLSRLIDKIMVSNKYIYATFIFNKYGVNEYRMSDSALSGGLYNPSGEEWFRKCISLRGLTLIRSSYRYENFTAPRGKNFYVFSVTRAIRNVMAGDVIGAISIDTDVAFLRNICNKMKSFTQERIVILDGSGNIVYDTKEEYISQSLKYPGYDLKVLGSMKFGDRTNQSVTMDGKNYILSTVFSSNTDWKVIRILPEDVLFAGIRSVQKKMLAIMIVFILASLVLSIATSLNITKPLKKLMKVMKVIEYGDMSVRFNVKSNDEVGQLGHSFNLMIDKLDNLVNTVYTTQLRKKEAELNALQAQINPHFIYNTLESIRMTALLNEDKKTANMTLVLGKLLWYSINIKTSKIVTVREEMEQLTNYLALQNFRFNNRFELIVDMDEAILRSNIIKLIFQPIVENSIFHGLEKSKKKGWIRITGRRLDGCTVFDIEDNGVGMTEDELEQVTSQISVSENPGSGSRSVGLWNINERIRLYYGEEYGIGIYSGYMAGTRVRIRLPGIDKLNTLLIG